MIDGEFWSVIATGDIPSVLDYMKRKGECNGFVLEVAARHRREELVKLMIERGTKPGERDLIAAAAGGSANIIRCFLEHGNDINTEYRGTSALFCAAFHNRIEGVRYLAEQGADTEFEDEKGNTALLMAAFEGKTEMVECLVKVGANIHHMNQNRRSALRNALFKKHLETARLLIELGASLNEKDSENKTVPEWAEEKGWLFILDLISLL